MTDLPQIAQAVAKALNLESTGNETLTGSWICAPYGAEQRLCRDGSNVFSPYWQCRARDWLLECGIDVHFAADNQHCYLTPNTGNEYIGSTWQEQMHPASEFAARAIYELMREKM